jgi:hypothetical protein
MKATNILLTASVAAGVVLGCGADPTGNPDGSSQVDIQIGASRVETFTPVSVEVTGHGMSEMLQHGEIHIEHLGGGAGHTFEMTSMTSGYTGRIMFFEPGEHDLHFESHGQVGGMRQDEGSHRILVHRQHALVGPYWVEFEVEPAPVLQYETARIRFFVFETSGDGPGEPVSGLTVQVVVHDPDGTESLVSLAEAAAGRYEGDHTFGGAGLYELHLEIETDGDPASGDFHIPVLASLDDHGLDHMDHRGHSGHGTGM